MKRILAISTLALLAGCSLFNSTSTPPGGTAAPLSQANVQADLANALFLFESAGCALGTIGAAVAPVISIAGGADGSQVLTAVDSAGNKLCGLIVPPTALPQPAPANAAAATAVVPKAMLRR